MVRLMQTTPPESGEEFSTPIAHFFDRFNTAFRSFDGAVIAERYAEPYVACRGDGTAELFVTRAITARYFQRVLDDYSAMGVRSCRHRDLHVVDTGARHSLGTVTWELMDDAEVVVASWRESYVLVNDGENLVVRSSIDH